MTFKDPFQSKSPHGFLRNTGTKTNPQTKRELFDLKWVFQAGMQGSLSLCCCESWTAFSLMGPLWVLSCGVTESSGSPGVLICNGSSGLAVIMGCY